MAGTSSSQPGRFSFGRSRNWRNRLEKHRFGCARDAAMPVAFTLRSSKNRTQSHVAWRMPANTGRPLIALRVWRSVTTKSSGLCKTLH
eukprot:1845696-Lingulodinium_polyedra.AAC.1